MVLFPLEYYNLVKMQLYAFPWGCLTPCSSLYLNIPADVCLKIPGAKVQHVHPSYARMSKLLSLWRSILRLFRKRSEFVLLPGSQSRISIGLVKNKKEVTCHFHSLLLSNEPHLIFALLAKSCPSFKSSRFAGNRFYHPFPSFLCYFAVVPRLWTLSPPTSGLALQLSSRLLKV